MLINFTYEYVLVYIVKVWWYVILSVNLYEVDGGHDSCSVTWLTKVIGLFLVIPLVESYFGYA